MNVGPFYSALIGVTAIILWMEVCKRGGGR
jgi:hypothetical protein